MQDLDRLDLSAFMDLGQGGAARLVGERAPTAVVYANGTRRWFASLGRPEEEYSEAASEAHRHISDLFFDQGVRTLIQPLFGYDLLSRGEGYVKVAIEVALRGMTEGAFARWYEERDLKVRFFGDWEPALRERGYDDVVEAMEAIQEARAGGEGPSLWVGLFADTPLDTIARLGAQLGAEAGSGEALVRAYYGEAMPPVNLILGSGQPAIWDLPLLDINKAGLYFLQAPTYCLKAASLRRIYYDLLFVRTNDDEYDTDDLRFEKEPRVLGLGKPSSSGWTAL